MEETMKKSHLLPCTIFALVILAGCSAKPAPVDTITASVPDPVITPGPLATTAENTETVTAADTDSASGPVEESGKLTGQPIVWLGDSLTQGSLGDKDDNLENAPYERLKSLVDVPVFGLGEYGHTTHEVLWEYCDSDHYDQAADPDKTYIFWLGSNDWVTGDGANSDTKPVIDEIDGFLDAYDGAIRNYIVIGTTSRYEIGDHYIDINKDLADHYGEHYLDVIDIIDKYGYVEDKTHLTQASYDAVADAVFEKLKELKYIY